MQKEKAARILNTHYEEGDSIFIVIVKDSGPLISFTYGNESHRNVAIGSIAEDSLQDAVSHGSCPTALIETINKLIMKIAEPFVNGQHERKGQSN